jgi:hypothetical protein
MMARIWTGTVHRADAEDNAEYIRATGFAEPARPSSNELLAVAEHHWPNPAAHPRPAGRQGWGVGPTGLDRPATPPGRRPGPPGAPAVTGRLTTHRQRRRRITPNTNTTTTTMISTHNHVDMAASLVGPGAVQADATADNPSKQLGHRQATSRSRIDGRAARALGGPRHPATCPPI